MVLQNILNRVYFRVSAHLNCNFNVQQYTCISSRGSNFGPYRARHRDLCPINIEYLSYAVSFIH